MKSGQKADPPPAVAKGQLWDPKRGRDSLRVVSVVSTKSIRGDYRLRGRET